MLERKVIWRHCLAGCQGWLANKSQIFRGKVQIKHGNTSYLYLLQSWIKVMGQICTFGAFFKSHMPDPSPTPQATMNTGIQNLFQVSTLFNVGRGRTVRYYPKRNHCFVRTPRNNMYIIACVAGIQKGRGRELRPQDRARGRREERTQIPPSPSPFDARHVG